MLRRLLILVTLPAALAACGADPTWAPDAEVTRYLHQTGEPPSITLYTVIRKASGEGAHAGLMVDSGHRAIFDPAGTWFNRTAPIRNDVHYGITDQLLEFYIDYHARSTYYVVEQKIYVTPEQAATAMSLIENYGAVPKAFCANAVSNVMRQIPGFGDLPSSFLPGKIMRSLRGRPGVIERTILDDDDDSNKVILTTQNGTNP